MDCIAHGILQARILEWVAIPFSRGSSQPRDRTQDSCIAGGFLTSWAIREAPRGKDMVPFHRPRNQGSGKGWDLSKITCWLMGLPTGSSIFDPQRQQFFPAHIRGCPLKALALPECRQRPLPLPASGPPGALKLKWGWMKGPGVEVSPESPFLWVIERSWAARRKSLSSQPRPC